MKRALIALLVVGSVACALLVARADPAPDLTKGVDGIVPIDLSNEDLLTVSYQLVADDASLYLLTDCTDVGTCLVGSDDNLGGVEQISYLNQSGGPARVYAILDSFVSKIPVVGPSLLENQGKITGSWVALAIGLAGALWGSLRAFTALQTALDDIWEVEHGRRNYWVQRLNSLILICAIGAAQAGSVALAVAVGHAGLPRTSQSLLTFGGLALNIAMGWACYALLRSGWKIKA